MLTVAAFLSAGASSALFVFRPIPPIGLSAAIGTALYAIVCLFTAFFPAHALRIQRRVERGLGKEWSTHLGRWVP